MLRLLLLLALALPGQALAHASLLGSEPADGASLDTAPSSVVLRFDETVALIALSLIGPDGRAVPLGSVDGHGGVVRASVPPGLPGGVYLLSWRVTSADSHPVAGTAAFGVGMANRPVQAGRTAMDGASIWAVPSLMARWLFYAVLMAAAGGSLFRAAVAEVPLHVRRGLVIAALFGTVLCGCSWACAGRCLRALAQVGFGRPRRGG